MLELTIITPDGEIKKNEEIVCIKVKTIYEDFEIKTNYENSIIFLPITVAHRKQNLVDNYKVRPINIIEIIYDNNKIEKFSCAGLIQIIKNKITIISTFKNDNIINQSGRKINNFNFGAFTCIPCPS